MVSNIYGPVLEEQDWVPAPRYVLRRHRVLKHLDDRSPGQILEIGCGAGALLIDLAARGHTCSGYEISESAYDVAKQATNDYDAIQIYNEPAANWLGKFDYIMAFEVLEHIEDDHAALAQWMQWLRPDGLAIFSVPSNKNIWTPSDIWAGHCRRYDKEDLVSLCEKAGLTVTTVEHYGFPLANIVSVFRNRYHAKRLAELEENNQEMSRDDYNLQSGVERRAESRLFKYMDTPPVRLGFRVGFWMQDLTRNLPWGNGLLIVAQKK